MIFKIMYIYLMIFKYKLYTTRINNRQHPMKIHTRFEDSINNMQRFDDLTYNIIITMWTHIRSIILIDGIYQYHLIKTHI